jgi:hypothetical protein
MLISAAVAQPLQSPQDAVIRINVNLVQVDAVVTDSKDRPLTKLSASDLSSCRMVNRKRLLTSAS